MYGYGLDPIYFVFIGPGLLLGLMAAWLTKSTFAKYSQVGSKSGLTGAQAAAQMLTSQGIRDVTISESQGILSDHYDPRTHSLNLSPDVYQGRSLSSIGVACHEAGHALQKASGYALMPVRSALVPVTMVGQYIAPLLFMIGIPLHMLGLIKVGVVLFSVVVIFSIITLPVEWDASARAKRLMVTSGVIAPDELPGAAAVLNAAFMTYVAGAVTAILELMYYMYRAGLLGGRRNN